jgi:hypothetical protein
MIRKLLQDRIGGFDTLLVLLQLILSLCLLISVEIMIERV